MKYKLEHFKFNGTPDCWDLYTGPDYQAATLEKKGKVIACFWDEEIANLVLEFLNAVKPLGGGSGTSKR